MVRLAVRWRGYDVLDAYGIFSEAGAAVRGNECVVEGCLAPPRGEAAARWRWRDFKHEGPVPRCVG